MTSRLETISRISDLGKESIVSNLQDSTDDTTSEKLNFSQIGLRLSSYFDLGVAWNKRKALVLTPKYVSDPKRPDEPQMMTLNPGSEINSLNGDIKDICIIPMMSTKRADCGQPEIAIICIGFESGHVKFYLETGVIILEYQLHLSPVERIRFRGFSGAQPETSFYICHKDCVIEIDGMELYQTLRVARVSPEQVQLNALKSKKYTFTQENQVADVASVGKYSITRWEQYVNASAYGPNEKVSARIPAYNSYITSGKNFAQFYHHIDQVEQSAITSALSIGKSLMKKSTGWFFGGSQPEPEPEVVIDKGTEIEPRSTLLDNNRTGVKVEAAPYGLPFAAVSDNLGRVSIVETNSMKMIRIIKGVRDCQMSWLRSSDGARNALFFVTLDRLGVLSVFSVHYGPRVASWNVGKGSVLLSHSHQIGVNGSNLKQMASSNYQVAVMTAEGELKRIVIPLHLALSDHNSPRLADTSTLRELSKQLKRADIEMSQINALVKRLRLSNTQRQAIEKLIASEKIPLDDIEKYLELFAEKNKNESLSGKKETKDFQFWHEKISKMICAYKMITMSGKATEPVVDPSCIFKNEAEDDIKTILDTKRQISETRSTKIKFSSGTASVSELSLYDFTRCLVEDNGALKLHHTIRKKHLASKLFESAELHQIIEKLLLPLADYLELLKCHIANVTSTATTAAHFLRLLGATYEIFHETLPNDWLPSLREDCLAVTPSNGLIFVHVMEFFRRRNLPANDEVMDTDTADWDTLVIDNQWKEAAETLRIASALEILSDGINYTAKTLLQGGVGGVTEVVAEWLVENRLTLTSELHTNPRVALAQMFLKNYLVPHFPLSLSREMVNSSIFWISTSRWASSTKKSTCDQLLPLILESLNEIKEDHLATGAAMFVWKTLFASKFDAIVQEIQIKKKKITLSSSQKSSIKRSEGPAKIEHTLEIASNLLDALITNDPDASPPPDVSTELSKLPTMDSKKPSVCEISKMQKQMLQTLQIYRNYFQSKEDLFGIRKQRVLRPIVKVMESGIDNIERPISSSITEARVQFISFLLESLCVAVTKSKLQTEAIPVIQGEIRRLAADWELDCEVLVDIQFIVSSYSYGLVPPEVSVQDIDLLEDQLCSLLASSTRALISELDGEENAQFLSNMAPFNVNFWLDDKAPAKIICGSEAVQNLKSLCEGIIKIDGNLQNPQKKENTRAILRALEAL